MFDPMAMAGARAALQRGLDRGCGRCYRPAAHGVDRRLAPGSVHLPDHPFQLGLVRGQLIAEFMQHDLDGTAAKAAATGGLR